MDNLNNIGRNNNQDNIRMQLRQRLRANDSLNKYKKKKQNIESNPENEDLPLSSNKPLLTEISSQYKQNENTLKRYERPDLSRFLKKDSFLTSKYSLSRAYTPRRNMLRKNMYSNSNLNNHMIHNNTFYKHKNRISDLNDLDRSHTYGNKILNLGRPNAFRTFNDFNSSEINNSFITRRNNYNKENMKMKEQITYNRILNKKYELLKNKAREINNKLKETLKYQENLTLNNQNLKSQNQKLLLNLTQMKNQLENSKNELNEQMNYMRNLLGEKENIIINLTNELNQIKNQNENQGNINEENYNEKINEINNLQNNINFLQNQLNNSNIKFKNLLAEKQKKEQIFKQQLIQENQKYQNLEINFKNLQEKFNNNLASINQNQKAGLDNIQSQYQNAINDLNEKIKSLENENAEYKELLIKKDKQLTILIKDKNDLIDQKRELTEQFNQLKQSSSIGILGESVSNNMQIEMNRNNELMIKVNTLVQINNQLNAENNYLKGKINLLEKEKGELKNNLIILNKEKEEIQNKSLEKNNINNNINTILQEKNELMEENSELKNKIKELENENHKIILKLSKYSEFQKEYDEMKKENIINFEELKRRQEENQNLYNIIREKEKIIQQLKEEISKSIERNSGDNVQEQFNVERNREYEEKNEQIGKLEKKINDLKNINEKISIENSELKEKFQLIQAGKDEGYVNTINNLKDEIKDREKQIQILIEENKNLTNKIHNNYYNLNNEDHKEINSQELNDNDKMIKIYLERIKEYKVNKESDEIQIKTLKEEIKKLKEVVKNSETFGGQVKDINEFKILLNQALVNYKPKKKEQKEALNKIVNILNNFQEIKP